MSEDKGDYITDAVEMLGKGYDNPVEIHAPHTVLEMGENRALQRIEKGAWIKLSTSFRDVMQHLKGAKLPVFISIALCINDHGESFPSFETIAEWTGYSRRAVATAIQELEADGFLTVMRGKKKSNLYHVNAFAAFGDASPTSAIFAPVQSETPTSAISDTKNNENMLKTALKQDSFNKTFNNSTTANIFTLYTENIGLIHNSLLGDELKDYADLPLQWLEYAFKEAADANARNWRYVRAVLESCKAANGIPQKIDKKKPIPRSYKQTTEEAFNIIDSVLGTAD